MCAPQVVDLLTRSHSEDKTRAARKIVRKYRRRQERRQLNRLRRLLPDSHRPQRRRMAGREVIDETISLIVSLEQQLLAKICRQGAVPDLLVHTGLTNTNLSLTKLRQAMAQVIPSPARKKISASLMEL